MKAHRNFALGALLAVALAIPTLTESASATSKDNAIATLAAARNWAEIQLSCSYHMLSTRFADWLKQDTH